MRRFDPELVRRDVPELRRTVHGLEMAYLDSAASSLAPRSVIEAMSRYYERTHTNVHRGVYEIAEEATEAYELARRSGVEPRQVKLICHYLEIIDRLRRTPGPDGKIVNTLIDI